MEFLVGFKETSHANRIQRSDPAYKFRRRWDEKSKHIRTQRFTVRNRWSSCVSFEREQFGTLCHIDAKLVARRGEDLSHNLVPQCNSTNQKLCVNYSRFCYYWLQQTFLIVVCRECKHGKLQKNQVITRSVESFGISSAGWRKTFSAPSQFSKCEYVARNLHFKHT